MKTRSCLFALGAMMAAQSDVHGLNPPSDSDGPITLLACVVDPHGILEAEVDSKTEDTMNCNIRCNYGLGEKTFTHTFNVTIPGRFQGRVGRFDTTNGKTGSYSGDVGTCTKTSLHGVMPS